MGKVVKFYKPSKSGMELYSERVIHKLEVLRSMVNSWEMRFGKGTCIISD